MKLIEVTMNSSFYFYYFITNLANDLVITKNYSSSIILINKIKIKTKI